MSLLWGPSCPDPELGCSAVRAREEQDPAPVHLKDRCTEAHLPFQTLDLPRSFRDVSMGSLVVKTLLRSVILKLGEILS